MSLIRLFHESHWSISKWVCDVSEQTGVVDGVVSLSLQADSRQEDKQHQLAVCGGREDAVQHLRDREAFPGGGGVYPFSYCTPAGREKTLFQIARCYLLIKRTCGNTDVSHSFQGYFYHNGVNYDQFFLSVASHEEWVCGWVMKHCKKADMWSILIFLNWVHFQTRRIIHVKKWLWHAIEKDPPPALTITSL